MISETYHDYYCYDPPKKLKQVPISGYKALLMKLMEKVTVFSFILYFTFLFNEYTTILDDSPNSKETCETSNCCDYSHD